MAPADKIYEAVKPLPEALTREVFDFVEFLRNRREHESHDNLATAKRRPVLVLRPADTFGDFLAVAVVTSQAGAVGHCAADTGGLSGRHPPQTGLCAHLQAVYAQRTRHHTPLRCIDSGGFLRAHAAICTALGYQH